MWNDVRWSRLVYEEPHRFGVCELYFSDGRSIEERKILNNDVVTTLNLHGFSLKDPCFCWPLVIRAVTESGIKLQSASTTAFVSFGFARGAPWDVLTSHEWNYDTQHPVPETSLLSRDWTKIKGFSSFFLNSYVIIKHPGRCLPNISLVLKMSNLTIKNWMW